MLNQKLWDGVNILLDTYAHVQKEDVVIIVYAPDSIEATGWISTALEQRGITAQLVRTRPLTDTDFADKLKPLLPDVNSLNGKLVIITLERDTMSNTTELRDAMRLYPDDKCLIVRAMSEAYGFFNYGIQADPDELSARNTTILERCMGAKKLHLTTESGSDLHIELNDKYRWISNRGIFRPGNFLILPAGEVATCPGKINGTLVANFALHINMITKIDTRLNDCPATIKIKDNKVVSYHCDNKDIFDILDKSFNKENAKNIGELGFGTNYGVDIAVPENSHVNERRPGIHIGFGQHNQGGIIDYRCDVHMDLIAKGGLVWVDDESTPIDMENILPSPNAHPERLTEEDVFSPEAQADSDDCCGVICPTN